MKRFLITGAMLLAATAATAARTQTQVFANETGLAYSNTYTLDARNMNLKSLSVQVLYATTTFTAASFTDGVAGTGTVTVASYTGIHGTRGTDTLTVVSGKNGGLAAAKGTDVITVVTNSTSALNGASVTVNGTKLKQNQDWFIGVTSATTASSIASAINATTNFTAAASLGVVTVTCGTTGIGCNSYTLVSSTPAALSVSTAKFTGGQDAVFFTLNGLVLTNGTDWTTGQSSTNTAASIATAATVGSFTASVSSNVVTVTCVSTGTLCNAYTLATSSSAVLSRGAATFSGGIDVGKLSIGGVVLTEGTDFNAQTSSATTANNIAVAINASSALSTVVTATAPVVCGLTNACGVVKVTGAGVGTATNYSLWTSTYSSLTPFAPAMRGGAKTAVKTAVNGLNVPSHGFTTALPVLYTKSAGTSPGLLFVGTTYYVIPTDSNNIKLASSSANAVAGTAVSISTQTTTGGGTFALTPIAWSGTASFKWQQSNDCTNYDDVTYFPTTSLTSSTGNTPTTFDFGAFDNGCLLLNATAPTWGGFKLKATATTKL